MKEPVSLDPELLAAWARARGASLDAERAAAIRSQVESLVSRLRALGDRLASEDAPPPEGPQAE